MATSSRPATRAGGSRTVPDPKLRSKLRGAMPVQRRRRQTGRFANARRCWPPPVGLRPPYVAPAAAHSHQIAARFPPQILAPRGGHYWTRKGVTIGSDLTPFRLFCREIVGFGEILVEMEQLPFVILIR